MSAEKDPIVQLRKALAAQKRLFKKLCCQAEDPESVPFRIREAWGAYMAGNYYEAYRLFRAVAEEGVPLAQAHVGVMHRWGLGCEQNMELAWIWLARSRSDLELLTGREELAEVEDYFRRRGEWVTIH